PTLTRVYSAGLYYLAVTARSGMTNNSCPAISFTGAAPDFPDSIVASAYLPGDATLRITDGTLEQLISLATPPYELNWITLRVYSPNTCGSPDFDGDGDPATSHDIEAFFACLAGDCCLTCDPRGSDFNGDGDSATDADIEAFFRVLAGGS